MTPEYNVLVILYLIVDGHISSKEIHKNRDYLIQHVDKIVIILSPNINGRFVPINAIFHFQIL